MAKKKSAPNNICENRRAFFDYELIENFEAGVELQGWEVKSLRNNRAQIAGSYVRVFSDELYLVGANIEPLQNINKNINGEYDMERNRKLLLHRKEIQKIKGLIDTKGLSCVPLNLYWKGSLVKCKIATARGKKIHDKRESLKQKDLQRDMDRGMKY